MRKCCVIKLISITLCYQIKRSSITNKYKNYGNIIQNSVKFNHAYGMGVRKKVRFQHKRGVETGMAQRQTETRVEQAHREILLSEDKR